MGIFGTTAINAARNLQNNPSANPEAEWSYCIAQQTKSIETQKKGCPRTTFVTLAQVTTNFSKKLSTSSLNTLISSKKYQKNTLYAVLAYNLLRNGSNCNTPTSLWNAVIAHIIANNLATNLPKNHNSQMDVVLELWKNNFL